MVGNNIYGDIVIIFLNIICVIFTLYEFVRCCLKWSLKTSLHFVTLVQCPYFDIFVMFIHFSIILDVS